MLYLIKKFFLVCSGASLEILDRPECAIERNRFASIGAIIFLTSLFALLSGSYAMYRTFASFPVSLVLGMLWSLFVFALDRYIFSTLRRRQINNQLSFQKRLQFRMLEVFKLIPRIL